MAYRIPNKNIESQSKRTAVGISIPFSNLFNQTYTTRDAVKSNIINYFLTDRGERVLNPQFGSNLKKTLFEPLDSNTLSGLEITIKEDIEVYFPLVKVENFSLISDPEGNTVRALLTYSVLNNELDNIDVTFNTGYNG